MKKTILAIGDKSPDKKLASSSFEKFIERKRALSRRSIELKVVDYAAVLKDKLPSIDTKQIRVMLFFPFKYWDKHIEDYSSNDRIYGDQIFGRMFSDLFKTVHLRLQKRYKDRRLSFVNSPDRVQIDRDKKISKKIFRREDIPTPRLYKTSNVDALISLVDKGRSLYIKPRFGAMGKGVTFLTKEKWHTNYVFKNNRIISPEFDYGWDAMEITGNRKFLKQLVKRDVLCEEGIESPLVRGRKFDLRVYVIYGKVPYMYARSVSPEAIVTNWSQGGKIEGPGFLSKIPQKKLNLARRYAVKTARAAGLNYAGVDLIFSRDYENVYVLEAHSFPSYEKRFDLIRYLVDRI